MIRAVYDKITVEQLSRYNSKSLEVGTKINFSKISPSMVDW